MNCLTTPTSRRRFVWTSSFAGGVLEVDLCSVSEVVVHVYAPHCRRLPHAPFFPFEIIVSLTTVSCRSGSVFAPSIWRRQTLWTQPRTRFWSVQFFVKCRRLPNLAVTLGVTGGNCTVGEQIQIQSEETTQGIGVWYAMYGVVGAEARRWSSSGTVPRLRYWKTLVSRPTATCVTFDLPECK